MNYLWGGMILVGIVYGMFTGNMDQVTEAILDSGKESVSLCLSMAGIVSMWTGVMYIAEKNGLIQSMAVKMNPLLNFLFPNLPENHEARKYISTNMIANILGLGWAATPAGLKAMESLARLEEERRTQIKEEDRMVSTREHVNYRYRNTRRNGKMCAMPLGVANNEMCNFLIINISSLQLIPVNVIAYRSQYGSVNPTVIVGPGIVATTVGTVVAVVFCVVMNRRRRA